MPPVNIPNWSVTTPFHGENEGSRAGQAQRLAAGLSLIYRIGVLIGSNQLMRLAMRMVLKLEKGEIHSATARRLMKRYHDIDIGNFSYGCFDPIRFPNGVQVGHFTSIARSVKSYRKNHDIQSFSTHPLLDGTDCTLKTLEIEHDVWVGAQVIILPGCQKIGTGAVVGAGSVLTRNVESYTVVAGNPARVIKHRFSEPHKSMLLKSRWWDQPLADIEQASRHFNSQSQDRIDR